MAGRRLSIFQMLKDLKDTVSPVNPSSSDGPSSIFYVSSDGPDCSDSRTNWSIEDNNCYFAADSCRAADYYDQQEQVLELVDSLKSLEEGAGDSDKRAASIQGNKSSAEAPVGLDNKSPIASATPTPFQSMDELDRILQATFPDSSQTNNSAENNGASDNNIVTKKKSKSKSILGTAAAAAWKFKRRDSKRTPSSAADQFGDFSNTTSSTAAATEQNDPSVGPLSLESDYCNQVVHRRRSSVAKKLFKRKSKCDSTDSSGSSGGAFGLSSSLSSGLGSGSTISFSSEVSSGMTGKGSARSSTSSETLSDVFNWNFLQKLKFKNQSDDDISSIIPTSSTLVTQQLLTFDSTQECSSQTDAQILAHHQQQKDEGRTGDEVEEEEEDGNSVSISPAKSLLGRVRDFHRNGVFGFAGSSSGSSPNSHKSSPGDANNPNANHMLGRNGISSSSNDFYGSSNVATCNLSGQSYRGDSEEKNDVRRGKECGKNDTRNGGSSRSRKMTRAQGLRNDEALNGISGGSESLRNSSEEELTSINNVSVGRLPIPSAAATTVTTTVTMALPPARRSNLLNSSGAGSLSDSGSTTSTTGGGSSSMEDYNGPFVGKAVALVDCTPSPYDRHALRYKKGDVLQIICKKPTGSWTGKVNNQVGHFKFINVQVLPDDEEEEEEDVFDMDYEGDYSRDEDYYYNNCTRGGPASSGGYDSDSHSSIRRRNNRHHRKPSVMTPWELEQRQTVASVINGIRKENKALRHHHEAAAEGTFPDSPPTNEGSSSEPPYWNDLDGRGGGSKSSDSSLTKLTGIPAVKRTNSRRGERSKSSKQKKEKKGRPKSVGDLLQRIHLQEYISVFILHGFDSLDLFKELEEEDLDRLAIPNGADRAKILTAVELLREYDTEEEIPIPMIIPPAPPSLPPPSSSSATSSRGPSESRAFPRDSGIFVKCDEDCEGDAENLELSATSLSLKENPTSAQEHNPEFKSNGDLSVFIEAGGNANFSISRKNLDQMEDNDGSRRETNQVNDTALAATSSANEELILSPLNLHKIQVGGPSFPHNRSSSPEGQQADLFGDVKQRFLNAKSMFELATTNESPNPGAAATAKNNRFSLDKSADSGLSCPTNSPPLMRTDN